jgi:hypothetical protein
MLEKPCKTMRMHAFLCDFAGEGGAELVVSTGGNEAEVPSSCLLQDPGGSRISGKNSETVVKNGGVLQRTWRQTGQFLQNKKPQPVL